MADNAPAHPLIGKWFHSYEDERPTLIRWQGTILAEVAPGTFLVQLFEWFVGMPSKQVLVPLSAMVGWDFYDSHDAMQTAFDSYVIRRNRDGADEHPMARARDVSP